MYQAYIGLFTATSEQLIDLPPQDKRGIEAGLWGHPPLNIWRTGTCDADVRIHGQVRVGQRAGHYGWVMAFDELSCPKAYAIGSVFIYLNAQGREVWDLSQLQTINEPPVRPTATPGPGKPTVTPSLP